MNRAAKATAGVLTAAATMTAAYEGLYTHTYYDSVGVLTVCYGTTKYDRPVKPGDTYTPAQCKLMLAEDLKKYDDGLTACLNHSIPDGMHVAYISFTYNVGVPTFCKSSVARDFNSNNYVASCNALRLYNRAGGRVLKGLDNRRKSEQAACLKGINTPITTTAMVVTPEVLPVADDVEPHLKPASVTPTPVSKPWYKVL